MHTKEAIYPRRETAICICPSSVRGRFESWTAFEQKSQWGLGLWEKSSNEIAEVFLIFPQEPHDTFQTMYISCSCDSCWHFYTEQLTAFIMTKRTKSLPATDRTQPGSFHSNCNIYSVVYNIPTREWVSVHTTVWRGVMFSWTSASAVYSWTRESVVYSQQQRVFCIISWRVVCVQLAATSFAYSWTSARVVYS